MKDEEMADKFAEDYVMREDVITENDRVPFDNGYGFQTVDFEKEVKKGYKDGFLAGLNAGRPQWHKVVDGDLPKIENRIVLCICIGGYINNEPNYVYKLLTSREFCLFQPVIEWCELPTFDKE